MNHPLSGPPDSPTRFPYHGPIRKTFLVAIGLVFLHVAAADAAQSPVRVTISPSPFRADEPAMTVQFTAPATTTAGRLYFMRWQTRAPRSTLPPGCSPSSSINPPGRLARAGQRITLRLQPERTFGDSFCPGPSQLLIFTQLAKGGLVAGTRATYRLVADYRFRVYR